MPLEETWGDGSSLQVGGDARATALQWWDQAVAWSLLLRELGLGSKPAGALMTVAWRIHPLVVW